MIGGYDTMNHISMKALSKWIDISCVKSTDTIEDINQMIAAARSYDFICAFSLPAMTPYLIHNLKGTCDTLIGGTVGFPSGCDTTDSKVFQTKELLSMGCDEIDMVINIGQLKSNHLDLVFQDIKAVADVCGTIPLKTILEVTLLTKEEIRKASKLAESAGASYIKTGTGWRKHPTLPEHIRLIRSSIQPNTKIKAAGGIRDLKTLLEMKQAGCDRFGISTTSALSILKEAKNISSSF
jgi:deoxyribose-phosphate aldolase